MADDAGTRWDRRYRTQPVPDRPSPFVTGLGPLLPDNGRALDLAGGAGRHAVWLARRGLDVSLVDVAPAALELAAAAAARAGVTLALVERDLETDPLPSGPWDLVLCFHYLQRDLFPAITSSLAPGGVLVVDIATVRNLERHDRPPRIYLIEEGELPGLVAGLDVVSYEEGWLDEGRHEARLVARRP